MRGNVLRVEWEQRGTGHGIYINRYFCSNSIIGTILKLQLTTLVHRWKFEICNDSYRLEIRYAAIILM